jgi:hypothetical protein
MLGRMGGCSCALALCVCVGCMLFGRGISWFQATPLPPWDASTSSNVATSAAMYVMHVVPYTCEQQAQHLWSGLSTCWCCLGQTHGTDAAAPTPPPPIRVPLVT